MVFTTTATTTVSVREAVLALAGTLRAFDLIHSGTEMTPSPQEAMMFWAQDDDLVILQILASRGIITTLSTCAFSLILPFASLGSRGIVLLAGLVAISS